MLYHKMERQLKSKWCLQKTENMRPRPIPTSKQPILVVTNPVLSEQELTSLILECGINPLPKGLLNVSSSSHIITRGIKFCYRIWRGMPQSNHGGGRVYPLLSNAYFLVLLTVTRPQPHQLSSGQHGHRVNYSSC